MRGFMILCFATVATAAPQYNYAQPSGGHALGGDAFSAIGSSIISGGGSSGGSFGQFGSSVFGGGTSGSASTGFGSISGGGAGHAGHGIGGGHFGGSNVARHHQTIYHKNIYIHSAPEEDLGDAASRAAELFSEKKNVNIIFIKTPENKGLEDAALQLAKSNTDDKTAIYVLNKQTDIGELKNKVDQIQDVTSKPQVHFVKYKTPEEADFAQRTIQASYDQLTGPTQVSNEGIAPVQNFIGALGGQSPGVYANGKFGQGTSYAPQQQYLPPGPSYLPA